MTGGQITDNKHFCLAWKIMLMQSTIQQIVLTKHFDWTKAFHECCSITALALRQNPTQLCGRGLTKLRWQDKSVMFLLCSSLCFCCWYNAARHDWQPSWTSLNFSLKSQKSYRRSLGWLSSSTLAVTAAAGPQGDLIENEWETLPCRCSASFLITDNSQSGPFAELFVSVKAI